MQLKDHIKIIGIELSVRNNYIYEHICLENIKRLYKQSGKCDGQQQIKDILEAAIVSTPEGFTNKSPISPMTSSPVKKPSAQKSLCMFTNVLGVNEKTAYRRVGAAQSKRKAVIYGITPWSLKQRRKGH